MSSSDTQESILNGISGAPGICIGKAYLVDREGVDVIKQYHVPKKALTKEKNRFKAAVQRAKEELEQILEETPEELRQPTDILSTHIILLRDKMLYGRIIETIDKEAINAEWALKKVVADIRSMFSSITDTYLKERFSDIVHVADRIMRNLVGAAQPNIGEIDKRVILVAHDLSPAETSQINLERVKGFVTNMGGVASHTSIIARTLDIPAVMGLANATQRIRSDDIIIVDGTAGQVVINPSEQSLVEFSERKIRYEAHLAVIARSSHEPARTTDAHVVPIMGNIELPEEVVSVIDHGGEGVGLYRTEFQYLSRPSFPTEAELFDRYQDVVAVMGERPVTIRTLDINGDKAIGRLGMRETNPALGLRAIRYCLAKPEVFQTQLRAILRAAVRGQVRVLFPMIATYEEVLAAKKALDLAAASLEKDKVPYNRDIEVGVMIEVPSAVMMADKMAEEVDFFSIGTNDLVQYSLAIDRGNQDVAMMFSTLHPAIIRMLRHVTKVSQKKGIKLFMCGEMAGDPVCAPVLLGLGINELSMTPKAIPAVKNMIRELNVAESQKFVAKVIRKATVKEVTDLVYRAYGDLIASQQYSEDVNNDASD